MPLMILLPILTVGFIFWTIFMRLHSNKVLIRAGAWPACCLGDRTPRVTRDGGDELRDLRAAVRDMRRNTGRLPTVVSSGWGFFLSKEGPKGPRLFLHKFNGQMPSSSKRWAAGTAIATVQRHFEKQGQAMPSTPTMSYIGVGSWAVCGNHGNGSAPGMGKSDTLLNARVLDMQTDRVLEGLSYPDLRVMFDGKDAARYVLVDMEVKAQPNVMLQKKGLIVDGPEACAEWLAPTAKLRVLFAGKARSYGLGLTWQTPYEETSHTDPHFLSRYCLYLQADICSVVGGCHEPMKNFRGKTTLANATRWTPAVLPIELILATMLGVTNFEIIVENETALTGKRLWELVSAFIELHRDIGGRCEFRTNGGAGSKLYIDLSLMRGFEKPFELLRKLRYTRCALHPGKFTEVSTQPLKRVTLYELNSAKKPTMSDVLRLV